VEGTSANWRKSSYSGSNGGACVEVGNAAHRVGPNCAPGLHSVVVRDTTNRAGTALTFPADAWRTMLAQVRAS
jgi:hypothetical protein